MKNDIIIKIGAGIGFVFIAAQAAIILAGGN